MRGSMVTVTTNGWGAKGQSAAEFEVREISRGRFFAVRTGSGAASLRAFPLSTLPLSGTPRLIR